MAHVYPEATMAPTKMELLQAWLPTQSWFPAGSTLARLGAYRFDDPDGEVGMEAFLLAAGEAVLHVPLTYRASPLDGADAAALVGTSEHSVLGTRWVYDGCADPVWAGALAAAVLTGGRQADVQYDVDGHLESHEPSTRVEGSGSESAAPAVTAVTRHDEATTTVTVADRIEIVVARVVPSDLAVTESLTARWRGGGPAVVAGIRPR